MKNIFFAATLGLSVILPNMVKADDKAAAKQDDNLNIPGDFSGTVAFTSDYMFRGITQNDEEPAIQGSLDYSYKLNNKASLYLGVWGSNVDFNDNDEANIEMDWYGGTTFNVDEFSFDIGAIYYTYPGAADSLNYDYYEFKGSAGYDFKVASITGTVNYTPENFGKSGNAEYYQLAGEIPLPKGFTLNGHIGRQMIDKEAVFGKPDYTDWAVGIAYNLKGVDIKVEYIDTNLGKTDCADGCDSRAVLTVSKNL